MAHFSHDWIKKYCFVFSEGLVLSSWSARSAKALFDSNILSNSLRAASSSRQRECRILVGCTFVAKRFKEKMERSGVGTWGASQAGVGISRGSIESVANSLIRIYEGKVDVEKFTLSGIACDAPVGGPRTKCLHRAIENKCFGNQKRTPRAIYFHTNEYWLSTALDCSLVSCGKDGHLVKGFLVN